MTHKIQPGARFIQALPFAMQYKQFKHGRRRVQSYVQHVRLGDQRLGRLQRWNPGRPRLLRGCQRRQLRLQPQPRRPRCRLRTQLLARQELLGNQVFTECPKIYRKSVLHLLKYTENLCLSRFAVSFGTLSTNRI